jgi:hypothetical protein
MTSLQLPCEKDIDVLPADGRSSKELTLSPPATETAIDSNNEDMGSTDIANVEDVEGTLLLSRGISPLPLHQIGPVRSPLFFHCTNLS